MVPFIIIYTGCVLFCCLSWTSVVLFRSLHQELLLTIAKMAPNDQEGWLEYLDGFRRRYLLIVDLVSQTSHQFGVLLLTVIGSEFVRITNATFTLLMGFYGHKITGGTLLTALDFFKETAYICLLVSIPSFIQDEVFFHCLLCECFNSNVCQFLLFI